MKRFLLKLFSLVVCAVAGTIMVDRPARAKDAHGIEDARTAIGIPSAPTPTPGCFDGWAATSTTNAPSNRSYHTAVWTGSEMVIWGGAGAGFGPSFGRIYHPDTDSWTAVSGTNSPSGRQEHTAVWTGSEMIIWGGYNSSNLNSGGRYNPGTDTWTATSTTNAPSARAYQVAVWTGSEMIVWGGYNGTLVTSGGRYNPATDTWTATSNINAPSGRSFHSAVWTGSEMIVWGGYDGTNVFGSGGRYNPSTDTWTVTSTTNAPASRSNHRAVWTGSEMIVWGGYGDSDLNSGGRYNPVTDTWVATSETGAPPGRSFPAAVWTGSEMIVWGGYDVSTYRNTGGRYNPGTNSWMASTTLNAPSGRTNHTGVWTGSQMIVWGGFNLDGEQNTGGRYCAQPATPTPGTFGNIATRLRVETGDNILIGGFIITGTEPKRIIVRAIGPSLSSLFSGTLEDPILELRDAAGGLLGSNDNWRSDQETEIIATGIPPSSDLESAIVATLPANSSAYTALVRGANNGTGIGVVEVYDLDPTVNSKLANISTRGFVQTGNDVLIGGLIVVGQNPLRVIVRAIGPSLPVTGSLENPTLELHDGNGALIAANDNWRSDQEAEIIATGIPPSNDLESAIVRNLAPGNYTAIVLGVSNTTGIAVVEAYGLN